MQKETNMAVASRMTCQIGLIWRHVKTLYTLHVFTKEPIREQESKGTSSLCVRF